MTLRYKNFEFTIDWFGLWLVLSALSTLFG